MATKSNRQELTARVPLMLAIAVEDLRHRRSIELGRRVSLREVIEAALTTYVARRKHRSKTT